MKFFIHLNARSLIIVSVSASNVPAEGNIIIGVSDELGKAFMMGTANISSYYVIRTADNKLELHDTATAAKRGLTHTKKTPNRIDVIPTIHEVLYDPSANIQVELDTKNDVVEIHYNQNAVDSSVKLYFTKLNDASILKATYLFDVNTLNAITIQYGLNEWPNPVRLKIADVHDLSVFSVKGQSISVKNKAYGPSRAQ